MTRRAVMTLLALMAVFVSVLPGAARGECSHPEAYRAVWQEYALLSRDSAVHEIRWGDVEECTLCGTVLRQPRSAADYPHLEGTEPHDFGPEGVCTLCGYTRVETRTRQVPPGTPVPESPAVPRPQSPSVTLNQAPAAAVVQASALTGCWAAVHRDGGIYYAPDTGAARLGRIRAGERWQVCRAWEQEGRVWYEVTWNGGFGWISGVSCSVDPASRTAFSGERMGSGGLGLCRITIGSGNVRSGPGTDWEQVAHVAKQEAFEVYDVVTGSTGKDWYYINHEGTFGWISSGIADYVPYR